METVALPVLRCHRCGKAWTPRRPLVRMCPGCKSRLFATPRRPSRATVARLLRQLEKETPPSLRGCGPIEIDFRRRRDKDELLAKHGMRPSRRYASKGV